MQAGRAASAEPLALPAAQAWLPAERLQIIRTAFDETMRDPAFITEVTQSKIELAPLPGPELQALVARQISTSPALRARILALRLRQ